MPAQTFHTDHPKPATLALLIFVTLGAIFVVAPSAHAQIPLGSVSVRVSDPVSCGTVNSSFYNGMQCRSTTVSCPNTDDIGVTFGYIGPTVRSSPLGTVVFFAGSDGTSPYIDGGLYYAGQYVSNYTIVQFEWSAWQKASPSGTYPDSILAAACRPATLLKYFYTSNTHQTSTAMCAQGSSAGSAAIAYAMSWYGAAGGSSGYLTNVELQSGPVLSEIDQGCSTSAPTLTLCNGASFCTAATQTEAAGGAWTNNAGYTPNDQTAINQWSGLTGCGTSSGSGNLTAWKNMSIVDGSYSGVTPVFSFGSGVHEHGWLCYSYKSGTCTANCPNNSAAQGYYWYTALNGASDVNFKVTGTQSCNNAEGVSDGTDPDFGVEEKITIANDMTALCE
jgi:hypothetical protein